ncbi:Mitogen-activated protein kinase kinase (MAP2K) [Handroanthus impetiginosus]|uniref:mitogen-activated protein kinase kinase n=1 Tax=Handroanthus impetiginosus TaxID=429701 RepID=A0A2G9HZ91_9LAMI|nr:Mitogen-activated protein kinase kinase (MAP2K) [Handroanthus impetiginosus]
MTLVRERRHQQALRLTLPQSVGVFMNPSPVSSSSLLSSSSLSLASSSCSSSPANMDTLSNFRKLSVLGSGNGGIVYKVSHKQTGAIYALKVVRFSERDVGLVPAIREAEILQRVDSSEYIVKCVGVFHDGSGFGFLMEYMDYGSLCDILCKKTRLSERAISWIVRSVLKGLKYLHGLGILHRDIKPSNLLVNARGEIKMADFGASRVVAKANVDRYSQEGDQSAYTCTSSRNNACKGTRAYMSPERMDPEQWDGEPCDDYAGDIWSLGVVAMECYMGRFPLVGEDEKLDWVTLMCVVCLGEKVESSILKMASPEFESFCRRCLERNWRKRGTLDELLLHPFVNKFEDSGGDDLLNSSD